MENLTWNAVLTAIVAVMLFLWKGVPFFTWLSNLITEWRKRKSEKAALNISQSADIRRLELDDRSKTFEEMRQIIEQKDRDNEKLEKKVELLEQTHSLPRPMMTKIYTAMRKLGTQIENVKRLFNNDAPRETIQAEIEILEQKFFEMDKLLP